MVKVAAKFAGGLLLGLILYVLMCAAQMADGYRRVFCMVWGVGLVGGFRAYLLWMSAVLNTSLKVSMLAWFSFGSGLIGLIFRIFLLACIIMIGWIYGWIQLIRELIAVL